MTAKDFAAFIGGNRGSIFGETQVNYMIKYFDSRGNGNIVYFE